MVLIEAKEKRSTATFIENIQNIETNKDKICLTHNNDLNRSVHSEFITFIITNKTVKCRGGPLN